MKKNIPTVGILGLLGMTLATFAFLAYLRVTGQKMPTLTDEEDM